MTPFRLGHPFAWENAGLKKEPVSIDTAAPCVLNDVPNKLHSIFIVGNLVEELSITAVRLFELSPALTWP